MPDTILVCFAVPQEAAPFQKRRGHDHGTRILVTGMGENNTRNALLSGRQQGQTPDWKAVITCGFAGGLKSRWNRGDVLVWSPYERWTQAFVRAGAQPGQFMASDRILIRPEEKERAGETTGCDAVEMESSVVHRMCEQWGIPAVTVRVISDARDDVLPLDFNRMLNDKCELPLGRILGEVLKRPSVIPGLIRLGRHSSQAAQRLAQVLDEGLRCVT